MNDLIVNINFKESDGQGCVVETFIGEIKRIKKKTYSGPLRNADIFLLDSCNNISVSELNECRTILENSLQISKNRYFVDDATLNVLINKLYNITTIYYKYCGRELNEITEFKRDKVCQKPDISICGTEYCIVKNTITYFPASKGIKENNSPIEHITPSAELFLEISNKKCSGKLFFSYKGYMVPSNDTRDVVFDKMGNTVCLRNLREEKKYFFMLKKIGWNKSIKNVFSYENIENIGTVIEELLKHGFKLFTKDRKKILTSSNMAFNTAYGIDWLELDIEYNNRNINQFVDFKSKKRYVELREGVVFLPDIISEKAKIFSKSSNKIMVPKSNVGDFYEIFSDTSIKSNFDKEKFIDYSNIKVELPPQMQSVLREYQLEGVKWLSFLYVNKIGGCLADDMGLGKTLQAIAFLSNKNIFVWDNAMALIIVPKTLIKNWENEVLKFNPQLRVTVYHGANRASELKTYKKNGGILLSTYNTVLNDIDQIKEVNFDCAILDEVQYIKNSKSKTYAAIKKINATVKIALSGTPFENNLAELWAIMDLINHGSLDSKSEFIKKYNDINDKELLNQIQLKIRPFILRRLKSNVLDDLPQKNESTVMCSMADSQRELYNVLKKSLKEEINKLPDRYEIKNASMVLEGLTYLRQVCCHPKILKREYNINNCKESDKFELFKNMVEELQANEKKVVVFSQFTSMLKEMTKWAEKKKYNYFYLDGDTTNRQEIVDQFENSKTGVFFISLKAGGVGLNLVSCQYAILYDPWWNPAVENQAADRIYRIGQKSDVFIYKLITENSIEEKIQNLQEIKEGISEELFGNFAGVKKLTYDDLIKLID